MQESYRFGRAELRPDARQLLIDGQAASLGGRAFDMLQVLVERRGRLVKKTELLDLVWPGLVVEENNLQVQMSHLRKLLGAQAISTIPGRGYRFDAPVEVANDARAADAARIEAQEPPPLVARLLGRERDLREVARMCAEHQLVTILGAGGIGKTRVAQAYAHECAARFPDGIVWADLALVSDSAVVPLQLARAFGITLVPNVDPFEPMLAYVRARKLLLIIDNAEHLADPINRVLRRLLPAGPGLHVLVTSQQPLRTSAEYIYRIDPLSIPEQPCSVEEALTHSAVALLCERVSALDRRFQLTPENLDSVIRICKQLDGMPLAIELAAGRLPLLGVAGLLEHLDTRFDLLRAGDRNLPTRQHTLRATVEWSHALLGDDEKRVLRRVAVSVGGFDLDLARRLASDGGDDDWTVLDALGGLVDRSWVNVDGAATPRYSFAETARSYALLTLHEAGEFNETRRRHGEAIWRMFDQAYEDFWTMGDNAYVARYAKELDNFRAAMGWAREGEPVWYVAMAASALPLLRHLSLIREGVEYLGVAEGLVTPEMPLAVRARLALSSAMMGGGRSAAERALALNRELGEARGLVLSAYWVALRNDVHASVVEEMIQIKRRYENPAWSGKLLSIGRSIEEEIMYRRGQYAEALASIERRVMLCDAMGAEDGKTSALMYKMSATFGAGDFKGAIERGLQLVERCRRLNNNYRLACCQAHIFTGMLVQNAERRAEAATLSRTFASLDRTLGWPHVCDAADGWSLLAALDERLDHAAILRGFAEKVHRGGEIARDALSDVARARTLQLLERTLSETQRVELESEGHGLGADDAARLALPGWPN